MTAQVLHAHQFNSQGKSLFLQYAYAKALQSGIPTIYCNSPGWYWVVDKKGYRRVPLNRPDVYLEEEAEEDTLILVDSSMKMEEPPFHLGECHPGYLVHATSPRESRWKEWKKERGGMVWIMDAWTKLEVGSLQCVTVIRASPPSSCSTQAFLCH